MHYSNSSLTMLYLSYPKRFSSTSSWEYHVRLWGGCERTFPSGTHIHRRHTCCLLVAPSLNECLLMTQPPKYLNHTTSTCLCHAVRSRTMLSRLSFGYLDQTSQLAPVGKWHFQCPPLSSVPSRNNLPLNHRPVCHCHPRQRRNPWAKWTYQSPEHNEADSIDNTAHTPMSAGSEGGWDCSPTLFPCPNDAAWLADLLHNCPNSQSCPFSWRELSNGLQGDCLEQYWRHISCLGWVEDDWIDRPYGITVLYNDPVSI